MKHPLFEAAPIVNFLFLYTSNVGMTAVEFSPFVCLFADSRDPRWTCVGKIGFLADGRMRMREVLPVYSRAVVGIACDMLIYGLLFSALRGLTTKDTTLFLLMTSRIASHLQRPWILVSTRWPRRYADEQQCLQKEIGKFHQFLWRKEKSTSTEQYENLSFSQFLHRVWKSSPRAKFLKITDNWQ